jgi:hypothetical protein
MMETVVETVERKYVLSVTSRVAVRWEVLGRVWEDWRTLATLRVGDGMVSPGETVRIFAAPQIVFRPDSVEVLDPESWSIEEIAVTDQKDGLPRTSRFYHSLFVNTTPASAKFFDRRNVQLPTVNVTMWVLVVARNVSKKPCVFNALFEGPGLQ